VEAAAAAEAGATVLLPAMGELLEVEVAEPSGAVVWKAAEVRTVLHEPRRFVVCVNGEEDFLEEYGIEDHGTEWRWPTGRLFGTKPVSGAPKPKSAGKSAGKPAEEVAKGAAAEAARKAAKKAKAEAAEAARAERAAALAAELNSIDKVLDSRGGARGVEARGGPGAAPSAEHAQAHAEEQFLCKLKGVAHVHAQWMTAAQIAADGRLSVQRLQNFERKREAGVALEPYASYMEVDRVIAASGTARPIKQARAQAGPTPAASGSASDDSADDADATAAADDDFTAADADDDADDDANAAADDAANADAAADDADGGEVIGGDKGAAGGVDEGAAEAEEAEEAEALRWLESAEQRWLVKWRGLAYDHCTWEDHRTAGEAHIAAFKAHEAAVAARASAAAAGALPQQGPATSGESPSKEDVPAVFSLGRPPVPGGRVLREYQRDGVRWLRYNYAQSRSAVLGDEMGLGKTAQAATLLHCLHTMHGVAGPFLLVVPLSTLQHWQRELDAWTTLHSVIFHGPKEARDVLLEHEWVGGGKARRRGGFGCGWSGADLATPRFDACITTYETLVNCADIFQKVPHWAD
jgi:hypothetical protein